MADCIIYQSKVPVVRECDVLVVGAGPAGVCAAVTVSGAGNIYPADRGQLYRTGAGGSVCRQKRIFPFNVGRCRNGTGICVDVDHAGRNKRIFKQWFSV